MIFLSTKSGNNLAGLAHKGLKGQEMNVLGSYFNFSIVISIFLGSSVGVILANVVKTKV